MNRIAALARLRATLGNGGTSVGTWMQIPHASVAEILGQAGYDWVALDLEHGAISLHQIPDLCRALELGGTLPLARVAQGSPVDCKHALDAGAGGVIVPMVESAEQLIAVRDACRWPPAGRRGVGYCRANLFGKHFQDYSAEAQRPLLVAMIEHSRGVDNLDAITRVDGVDALFVGPYDLSASLGVTGRFDDPRFIKALETVTTRAAHVNMPCGIHVVTPSLDELAARRAQGFRFIAYSVDAVFLHHGAARPPDDCASVSG